LDEVDDPARIVGLASNFLFFSYGVYGDLVPIMVLHGCLFPLNALRLMQSVRLKRRIHEMAHAEFDVNSLLPFMTERRVAKGEFLCRRGDEAQDIFYLRRDGPISSSWASTSARAT